MSDKSEQNLLKEKEVEILKNTIKQLKSRKRYGLVWNSEKEPERVVEFCKEKLPILVEDGGKQIKTDIITIRSIELQLCCLNAPTKATINVKSKISVKVLVLGCFFISLLTTFSIFSP